MVRCELAIFTNIHLIHMETGSRKNGFNILPKMTRYYLKKNIAEPLFIITMTSFKVLQHDTLPQAVNFLAAHEDLRILAGGTDIVVNLRNRLLAPAYVLDLKGIKDLHGVRFDTDGLRIGALTTISEVA